MTASTILSLSWTLFTTVPGLAVTLVLVLASFVSGVAYARRAMRRDPEGFAEHVAQAKGLAADVRAKWAQVRDTLRG